MATERQKEAIENVVENGGNVSRAMLDAGYSPNTAKTPQKLTESKAWEELMKEHLPDVSLAKVHEQLLHSEEQPIQVKALDMGYKLKGKYAPEKKSVELGDKTLNALAELNDEQLLNLATAGDGGTS